MFAPDRMRGTHCPGSDSNRGNHDCGFKYDEKTGKLTSGSQPPIMGDHALKRMALNTTTWGALCWSCIVDEGAANTVLDGNLHLLNYVDVDVGEFAQWAKANVVLSPAQKARSYIFRRFATFFQLLSTNNEIAEQQIQPNVFLNEVLIELMNDAISPAKPAALKSVYATVQEAINYEEHMKGIFNRVLANIKDRQEVFQVQLVKSNKIFALAQGLKRNSRAFGPIFSFDKFTTVLANTQTNQYTDLILEFIRNMNSPSLFTCLQYATQLITFYHNTNMLFNNRLTTEDTLKPISECIQLLRMYESEDIVKQFETSFAEFKKSWEEISYLLITLDPEACAGQAFELEVPQIDDDTPFIVLISDPSDPRCMDSIIKVLTTLFNRQEKLLSMCDAILPDTRPDPVQAEWLPLHSDHQFMLLNSIDLDYVKHVCVSQLTLPDNATIHIPHNGLLFNTQHVALFLIRLLQSKPIIKLGGLKQRFNYKIGESADFLTVSSLGSAKSTPVQKPVVELVRAQMGVNPIQYRANSIREASRFAVPLELTDRVRVKQLLSTLSDLHFTKLCDQLSAILTWIMLPSVDQHNQLNGLLVEAKNTLLHSLAKEALQLADEDPIGPMSFAACYLKDIALLVVDFHNLRAKLFQYSPDVDEELSEAAQTQLNTFAATLTQKKKWFDKIKQLLGELQQPRVANLLEANMHKPLRIFIKKEMAGHGWTDDEIASVLPSEVQARNFGAYLRHMYRLCGDLSFSFSSTKSTTAAAEQGVYVELVPDGIITAEPEGSNYVEAPDYSKLEEEEETNETPNLITEFNAPNVKPNNIETEQSVSDAAPVTGAPRDVPKLIKNLGNTCYMSSVLQVLTALSEITSLGLAETTTPLSHLIQHLYANDSDDSFYPRKFQSEFAAMKKAHKLFKIGEQQDAHEFMVHLIDSLPTAINQLFKIDLSYTITCQHCQHVESGATTLFDLPLDMKPSGPNQLNEMLNAFVNEPVEEWVCTACQKNHEHNIKHYRITKLPKVLVLVFKRFKTTMFSREKDSTDVAFPTKDLTLKNFSDDLTALDLFGSVVHTGSLSSGHYYSYFMRDGQWYKADDLTQRIRPQSVPSKYDLNGSYIVFYSTVLPTAPVVEHVQSVTVQDPVVQENHQVSNRNIAKTADPVVQDRQQEELDELSTAVQLNALLTQLEQSTSQNVTTQVQQPVVEVRETPVAQSMTSSVVEVKEAPVTQSTTESVVELKETPVAVSMTSSESKMNNSLTSSGSEQKIIVVRKLGAKRGGAEVTNPQSIQDLLAVGGTKLKIQAVNVRRLDTEAEIDDLTTIQHKEVVYLTTEEEEKEF